MSSLIILFAGLLVGVLVRNVLHRQEIRSMEKSISPELLRLRRLRLYHAISFVCFVGILLWLRFSMSLDGRGGIIAGVAMFVSGFAMILFAGMVAIAKDEARNRK